MASVLSRDCARGIRTFLRADALARNTWRFVWQFGSCDEAFVGHFPHQPILAGVFLVEMSQRAVEAALSKVLRRPHRVIGVDRFRFFNPVLPGDACTLEAEWTADAHNGERQQVMVTFNKGGKRVAQGVLRVACQGASDAP